MAEWTKSDSPNVERRTDFMHVGPPHPKTIEGRYVAAICPHCGGWTMMHGDPLGATGKEWMIDCYARGEVIVYWKNPISLGPACPQSWEEARPNKRTCGDA